MINNFDKLTKYLNTLTEDEFLFLQVIQRKKEVKSLGSNNRLIKSYFIDSKEKLDRYEDEIKKLCEVFNARAYVHLSPRNNERLFSEMLLIMVFLIFSLNCRLAGEKAVVRILPITLPAILQQY